MLPRLTGGKRPDNLCSSEQYFRTLVHSLVRTTILLLANWIAFSHETEPQNKGAADLKSTTKTNFTEAWTNQHSLGD
jgi:hypothetical protein